MRTSHCITVDTEIPLPEAEETEKQINEVIQAALLAEGLTLPCEINLLFTDDAGIQEINLEQREIDAPTDVLSFPMLELRPGTLPTRADAEAGSGLIPLGDMVLSYERVLAQAAEFGHSARRELSYLLVHSVLHLLGYDHLDEGEEKAQMRAREEEILAQLGIKREED